MEMSRRNAEGSLSAGHFWPPAVAMMILTPFFFGFASAGAGRGSYFFAKVLFPFTLLSTLVFDTITIPFFVLGQLQFPAYGAILGLMNRRSAFIPAMTTLLILHGGGAAMALVMIGENFS